MEDNGEKKCRNEKDSPILGDIESNFTRISGENKKKLRNAILFWGRIVLILFIITRIFLFLNSNRNNYIASISDDEQKVDQSDAKSGPYGNIYCYFDVNQGDTQILSEEFEYDNNVVIYIGKNRIPFTRNYNFSLDDSKNVRYEIYKKDFSMKNMFKGLDKLTKVDFSSDKGAKIISMESAFESTGLKNFNFAKSFDTSQMTSMKKAFAFSKSLSEINFDNMNLSSVKDMSYIF